MRKHGKNRATLQRVGHTVLHGLARGAATTVGASATAAALWWYQSR